MIIVIYSPFAMATFQIDGDAENPPLALSLALFQNSHTPNYMSITGYSYGPTYRVCETPLTPMTTLFLTTIPDVIGFNTLRPAKAYWIEGMVYEIQETRHPSAVFDSLPTPIEPFFYPSTYRTPTTAPVPWTGTLIRSGVVKVA